jgi:pSer/pThr/pTyr-binding forkhead associated (FHA) protein
MAAQLVPINAGSTPIVAIARPVILIGRHPECDVRLDSPQISRRHCCVALAYDRVVIRDLGSRHGVRVNGVAVDEAQLYSGDEVAISHLLYRFESLDPPARKPKTPKPAKLNGPPSIVDLDGDFLTID